MKNLTRILAAIIFAATTSAVYSAGYNNDSTAANNTTVGGIGAAGTSSPANLDNLIRELAAQIKQMSLDMAGANTVAGTADAITITAAGGSVTALYDGLMIGIVAGNDNATTAPTANLSSLGAKVIKKAVAGAETALAAGDIQSGGLYLLRYRSAWDSASGAWQLINLNGDLASDISIGGDITVGDDILLGFGAVINWNSGDIRMTHSANFVYGSSGQLGWYYNAAGSPVVIFGNQADSASVAIATLESDRATPTDGDAAYINLRLSDSGGTQTNFARQTTTAVDVTNTTEDGSITWSVMKAGTLTDVLTLDATGLTFSNGAAPNAATLLGTITLSGDATESLTSLTLTNYKFLRFVFNGASHNSGSNQSFQIDSLDFSGNLGASASGKGIIELDLTTGIASGFVRDGNGSGSMYVGDTAYTTASTSVTVGVTGGTFDAGTVAVYAW